MSFHEHMFFACPCLLILFSLVGRSLLPDTVRKSADGTALFLLSPLVGMGCWLAVSLAVCIAFGFGITQLAAVAVAFGVLAWRRRRRLAVGADRRVWAVAAVLFCIGVLGARLLIPVEIDGGLYFHDFCYDHVKAALIESMAVSGLPPLNPWLADGGTPVTVGYYYGFYALAAQYALLTGASGFTADGVLLALSIVVVYAAISGFACIMSRRVAALVFILIFIAVDGCMCEWALTACPALQPERLPQGYGFWGLSDNLLWAPHHTLSGLCGMAALYLHRLLLDETRGPQRLQLGILMGLMAAAAFFTSVYAGIFALLAYVCLVFVPAFLRDARVRRALCATLTCHGLAVVVGVGLTAGYLLYLGQYAPAESPLAFGIVPGYGPVRQWYHPVIFFLDFYLRVLPVRMGPVYVMGAIAVLVPGLLPKTPFVTALKRLTIVLLLLPFVIHSTFYSNDFGWRILVIGHAVLLIASALLAMRLYKRCRWAVALALLALLVVRLPHSEIFEMPLIRVAPERHVLFARAVAGWDAVRAHTEPRDMVLARPNAFCDLAQINGNYPNMVTNFFFSYYARRYTPIADLIFAQCYSEHYESARLKAAYARARAFFDGNPDRAAVDHVADIWNVRAILVTPDDGLWRAEGAIRTRYPRCIEAPWYKVYLP